MLEDLFEGSKRNRQSNHFGHDHYNPLLNLAQKLLRNKAILAGIVITILIIGAVGIWLIVTLLPYLGQAIPMAGKLMEQQGIKGILETVTPLLQKIWEGAGK